MGTDPEEQRLKSPLGAPIPEPEWYDRPFMLYVVIGYFLGAALYTPNGWRYWGFYLAAAALFALLTWFSERRRTRARLARERARAAQLELVWLLGAVGAPNPYLEGDEDYKGGEAR